MSLTRSIGRNTILQAVGKGIGTVLGLATIAILQRSLGTEGYGAYTTIMSFMGFFSVIADLGLYLIVLREIAKPGADKERIVGNALTVRIIAAVVILLLGIGISFMFPYSQEIRFGIAVIALSFFFIAVQQLLVSVFQYALRMFAVVSGEIVGRIVLLALVAWYASNGASLLDMIIAVVAGSFINAAIVFVFSRRIVRIRLYADIAYWKYLMQETWPIAISIVLNLLYFRLDTIFLSIFRSLEEVGLYGASYKILEILITFPNMFIGLIMPILSAVAFVNWDRFRLVFQKTFDMLFIAAVPLLVGGVVLAEPIVVFVGGDEFIGAAPYFRILMLSVTFLFFGSLSGHAVTAIHEQRRMVWRYLTVAVAGIILYLTLIPLFGAYGAAIGNMLTEGAIMIAGFHMIWQRQKIKPSIALLWKITASAVIMACALLLTKEWHVLLSVCIGGAAYVGGLLITKAIDRETIQTILTSKESYYHNE